MIEATKIPKASLRLIAVLSYVIPSISVSKQALHKRINEQACSLFEALLGEVIAEKALIEPPKKKLSFKRIIAQDSTWMCLAISSRSSRELETLRVSMRAEGPCLVRPDEQELHWLRDPRTSPSRPGILARGNRWPGRRRLAGLSRSFSKASRATCILTRSLRLPARRWLVA